MESGRRVTWRNRLTKFFAQLPMPVRLLSFVHALRETIRIRPWRGGTDHDARRLSLIRRTYRRRYTISLTEWLTYHQQHLHLSRCTWMGIRAQKNPLDAWIYQEIIATIKPDVIVEIGSGEGGSTLYLAHLAELLGHGEVVSVDIERSNFKVKHPRITVVTGDSSAPETVRQVAARCRGRTTLIIHDGNHHRDQVLRDLNAYALLVSIGSYFIVEDGIVDLFPGEKTFGDFPGGGPLAAVEQFLRQHDNFMVDADRERYLLTYNPRGYLRRIR